MIQAAMNFEMENVVGVSSLRAFRIIRLTRAWTVRDVVLLKCIYHVYRCTSIDMENQPSDDFPNKHVDFQVFHVTEHQMESNSWILLVIYSACRKVCKQYNKMVTCDHRHFTETFVLKRCSEKRLHFLSLPKLDNK